MKLMNPIRIKDRLVGPGHPCFVIAEMSANHKKSMARCCNLIEAAKEAGADAVKMQTYTPDTMTLNSNKKWFKITKGLWKGYTLYDLYKEAYMPWEWQIELKAYANKIGIMLFSTVFDSSSVDFLEKLKVPVHKVASFELGDIPLLKYVAKKRKPVILSTGMAVQNEIDEAVAALKPGVGRNILLLKCTSAYPAKPSDMNLRAMDVLRDRYSLNVGLSDHSMDIRVALAAVARGAVAVEKHFTLRRADGGPDASFSIEPKELKTLIHEIRSVEEILGASKLGATKSEGENVLFKRSIFVSADIRKGERLTPGNIRVVRPGNGLAPKHYNRILGKKTRQAINAGSPLKFVILENIGPFDSAQGPKITLRAPSEVEGRITKQLHNSGISPHGD
ncbi:MAG: pseudaminic acid synthase [Fibrobacterota bacterium]